MRIQNDNHRRISYRRVEIPSLLPLFSLTNDNGENVDNFPFTIIPP